MSEVTLDDVLALSYAGVAHAPEMTLRNTVLLLVDVQHLAAPEHLRDSAVAGGLPLDAVNRALEDYSSRFYAAVEGCRNLLESARLNGVRVVHVKIEAHAADAEDTGPAHARLGWKYPPGSDESRFLDAVTPLPEEIVVTKTVSGAFTATQLDPLLRHMGIQHLWVAGFETDECIEATVRAGLDLGYITYVVGDATTAYHAEAHSHCMAKYSSWNLARSVEQATKAFYTLNNAR